VDVDKWYVDKGIRGCGFGYVDVEMEYSICGLSCQQLCSSTSEPSPEVGSIAQQCHPVNY